MLPLETLQQSMACTLAHGPAHIDPCLFAMAPDRALLALKAHANTISHARLVALEDSYPLTRAELGDEAFNRLSRAFLDVPGVCREPLAQIGRAWPAFLASSGHPYPLVDLARAEWAWLQAYHGPEALPFELRHIAGLPEKAVLATRLRSHPASLLLTLSEPAGSAFEGIGHVAGATILLFTRPEADVRVTSIDPQARTLLARLKAGCEDGSVAVGDLLAPFLEHAPESDPSAAFIALAAAGAFALPEDPRP